MDEKTKRFLDAARAFAVALKATEEELEAISWEEGNRISIEFIDAFDALEANKDVAPDA